MKELYVTPEIELVDFGNEIITSSIGDEAPDIDGGEERGFII